MRYGVVMWSDKLEILLDVKFKRNNNSYADFDQMIILYHVLLLDYKKLGLAYCMSTKK